jgi:HAD superfamily hydrolase (TIGR01509 family)
MPLDIQRIRAICFDIDGTLQDTDDHWVQRLTAILQPLAFLFPNKNPAQFSRKFIMAIESPGNEMQVWLDRLGLDGWLEKAGKLNFRRGVARKPGKHMLIPGVKDALTQLKPAYPLAIVSVRSERQAVEFLEAADIRRFFDHIAASQTSKHTKPYPDPILWAAKKMQVLPSECLMVGDTTIDVRAGRAAGAQTVGVLNGFGEEEELRLAGADLILPSAADLPAILLAEK